MLGAIVGDIVGSIYERNNHRSKDFPFFGAGADYTDDSVLTMAVADALLDGLPPAKSLFLWACRHPHRGYGGGFARWLRTWDLAPYKSWGNGAAMRVSPAALLANTLGEALEMAVKVTEVTHNHPEGLKGAKATAHAIFLARFGIPDDIALATMEMIPDDMRETLHRLYARSEYAHPVPAHRPVVPLPQLRARYEALPSIVARPGVRTRLARLGGGWEAFLFCGRDAAVWLRQQATLDAGSRDGLIDEHHALVALVLEAWPV